MAEFETLRSDKVEFNEGGEFFELSVNIARDGERETRYLRLARGYYGQDGEPRYKRGGVTLPANKEVLGALGEAIKALDLSDLTPDAPEGGA